MKIKKETFQLRDTRYSIIYNRKTIASLDVIGRFIEDFNVEKEYRHKGLGTMLMDRVLRDFGDIDLSLIADGGDETPQKDLRRFYKRFGFKSDRRRICFMRRKAVHQK